MDAYSILNTTSYRINTTFIGEDQAYLSAAVIDENADPLTVCREMYGLLTSILKQMEMQIIHEQLYGSVCIRADILKARENVMRKQGIYEEIPITYIQGHPLWGEGFAGVQIYAFRSARPEDKIWTIHDGRIPCGRGWKRRGTTFLMLQNVHGSKKESTIDNDREEQSIRMFDRANRLLLSQGATYRNVVRTWIYLSDILDWYGQFNRVRNAKYKEFNLIPIRSNSIETEQIYLPASTGIEGDNPFGAAVIMDVLAMIQEPDSQIEIVQNTGSRQRSPYRYGSAFSRSIIIREPDNSHLYVSGTASIDERGKTLFPANPRAQIQQTFDIVNALIKRENASLRDLCHATVFLKKRDDIPIYREVVESYGLHEMPAICMIADICRDDLLFELDAIVAVENGCRKKTIARACEAHQIESVPDVLVHSEKDDN
jgi:enamine deaminase RidA (YjgF/YER057c/UK114 family)